MRLVVVGGVSDADVMPISATLPTTEGPLPGQAKGISLGQDAWRRLRRNRMAMASLVTLITIASLAFFTPLLPLAAPDKHHTELQYQPPKLYPLLDKTFTLDWTAIQETSSKMAEVRNELAAAEERRAEAQRVSVLSTETIDAATRDVRRKENELQNLLLRPYREAGFPDPGLVSRWMIRTRYRLFGEWTLGSVAGRDEFGRDVLSRVFWGARISIVVGIVATLVSLLIGVTYGALAGYIGGWVDDLMMRFVDILYSIPFIFVVIFIITILGEEHMKARLEEWGIRPHHDFLLRRRGNLLADDVARRSRPGDFAAQRAVRRGRAGGRRPAIANHPASHPAESARAS